MVKFILGAKGAGKTKWLIDEANKEIGEGNGNIAFVEVDDDHIFSLDYNVRLINATDYRLANIESLYGFLCGLMAMDYDLKKIYVDGIYKVIRLNIEEVEFLCSKLSKVPEIEGREIYINVDFMLDDMPEYFKNNCLEVKAQ
ncbi:hypothetical protein HMPREF3189_00038 [Clostridiales bacterium KA00134]|nr:hypothetical protein HMPREF3189_00038 [Clostridiales bacterium KA00134]